MCKTLVYLNTIKKTHAQIQTHWLKSKRKFGYQSHYVSRYETENDEKNKTKNVITKHLRILKKDWENWGRSCAY